MDPRALQDNIDRLINYASSVDFVVMRPDMLDILCEASGTSDAKNIIERDYPASDGEFARVHLLMCVSSDAKSLAILEAVQNLLNYAKGVSDPLESGELSVDTIERDYLATLSKYMLSGKDEEKTRNLRYEQVFDFVRNKAQGWPGYYLAVSFQPAINSVNFKMIHQADGVLFTVNLSDEEYDRLYSK